MEKSGLSQGGHSNKPKLAIITLIIVITLALSTAKVMPWYIASIVLLGIIIFLSSPSVNKQNHNKEEKDEGSSNE